MRRVRLSKTFQAQFDTLLEQGFPRFGERVVRQKRELVYRLIDKFLAHHPDAKRPLPGLGLRVYAVSKTPFVVLYDFDDAELRVHFVFHKHANLEDLDPASAEW